MTYHCDRCDLTLVMECERELHCLTGERGEHHCHTGELMVCADGSIQRAVSRVDCHVVNVYPVGI